MKLRQHVFRLFGGQNRVAQFCAALCFCQLAIPAHAETEAALTLKMVDERLSALRDSAVAEDASIYENYQYTRDLLVQAEVFQLERQQFVDAFRSAPIKEAEVQKRIDKLQLNPPLNVTSDRNDRNEIRAQLLTLRTEEEEAASELASLDRTLSARETSAEEIRERLASIRLRIEGLPEELQVSSTGGKLSESEAIAWKTSAEHIALRAERRALEARLSSQSIRYSLMTVQRSEQQLILSRLSKLVGQLETQLSQITFDVSDASALGFDSNDAVYPIAQVLVIRDTELREERLRTTQQLTSSRASIDQIKARSGLIKERYFIAKRMVNFAADSDSLGKLLLTHWQELEEYEGEKPALDISQQTAQTVIRRIEIENMLRQLGSDSAYLDSLLAESGIPPTSVDREDYDALRKLIRTYQKRLEATIDTQSVYLDSLNTLNDNSSDLKKLSDEYSSYLSGLTLWIPNFRPLWEAELPSVEWELDAAIHDFRAVNMAPTIVTVMAVLAFIALLFMRPRLLLLHEKLNKKIVKPREDSITHTLLALFITLVLSLQAPLLLVALAAAMTNDSALGTYLLKASLALLLISFGRRLCAADGVGALHFGWPVEVTERVHKDASWALYFWLPLFSVIGWMIHVTPAASHGVIIRIVIVALLLPSVLFVLFKVLREARSSDKFWLSGRLQRYRAVVALILLFIGMAITLGHVYSVTVVFGYFITTLIAGFALFLLHAVLIRWIQVTRRRLRMAELLAAQSGSETQADALMEEQAANLGEVSGDSRELVNASIAAAAFATFIYIWMPLLPALAKLSDITLWTTNTEVGGQAVVSSISLATILVIVILAGLTIYAAKKLPAVIDLLLRSQTQVSTSTRYTVSALLNYTVFGVGTVAAFSAMGLQWSQLQWLVAALGVGIGFGLQEIIANFISGLIILFERPIRVGDVVSTGENDGVVARIRIRATTIVDWEGRELLVPNKEFITGRLLNWSLTDTKIRLTLPVGVAYGSDVEQALRILHEVVSSHPRVLADPEPSIIFDSFGDNALALVARCFLDSMDDRLGVKTELNSAIYRRFEEANIVIAFPQRDIHLNTQTPIKIAIDKNND